MRERKVWRAPAWLFPDLRGIADPGQEPDHQGKVALHPEQYVSREDADRYRCYQNPLPARRGWTAANEEENHPGGILSGTGWARASGRRRTSAFARSVDWPDDIVGILVTPVGIRLDRGPLDHPKKRLRECPTYVVSCGRTWRGLHGRETDLLLVVRHAPRHEGFGLHRIARTVRRDGGERDAHLLLNTGHDGELNIPSHGDLDSFLLARNTADRFTRLVDLTWHDAGPGVVVDGARALPEQLAYAAAARFPEVFQVSVRADLLRDPAEVDRVAAEVSAKLLEADVSAR
jgi:hypothetical protein